MMGFQGMDFEFHLAINRPVDEVYQFFWTLDERDFSNNPLVPVYERVTNGPRRVGTVIREVVTTRFVTLEILSEIIEHIPDRSLGYRFHGSGTVGTLRYVFEPADDGTALVQHVRISFTGFRRILNPFLPLTYARRARGRLQVIKRLLEGP